MWAVTYEHWELWGMQAAWKSETWKTRSAEANEAARAKRAPVENCILIVVLGLVGEVGESELVVE